MPVPDLKAPVLPPTAIDKDYPYEGAVLGFDIRRPALKLPGIGRLGMTAGL